MNEESVPTASSGHSPGRASTVEQQRPQAFSRMPFRVQTVEEMYSEPQNKLEIEVRDPQTHGFENKRYTDYEVILKVSYC